ncbi:IclR helix-turn-helix domain-containing protein [Micromonospora echinaurantiaca]|uniref:IclR helix-turn-helix domain-containing protein n=1 Tax=Micromonospora echinaurantiaca TaxID=47857 RepID=A0A1C5IJX2_9ACTN|nr:helix-turn-helix domain-containing protein [Micromonospora echinaurantiaca]SCG58413.1 IclR helix-turn-helix domain-containing protein [Micromonospora echinaurantiaca]
MENLSLTPATQAVLDALTELGQGNLHELADRSGKARSTTDKAIKTLANTGLIVAVDTGADPADGTPTRWTLATPAEPTDAARDIGDLSNEHTAGADVTDPTDPDLDNAADKPDTDDTEQADQPGTDGDGDEETDRDAAANGAEEAADQDVSDEGPDDEDNGEDDEGRTVTVLQPTRPGDRKVMAIKGVLADYSDDGATLDVIVAESGIGHPTATRLLTAMEQADAARRLPGSPERWIPGPTKASEVDPNPEPPRCPLCYQVIRGVATTPSAAATVLPLIRPDGTLHVVGPDGETHVVTLPTRTPIRAAGVARSVGRRSDGTVNADGSQPFGRGELEKLTLDVLAANPGRAMTPQDIATVLGGQLGRIVSSGAVRNNCTKAAAAGRILLVSDTPLTFTYPAQAESGNAAQADAVS